MLSRVFVILFLLELVKIEHDVTMSPQISIQPLQRHPDHVAMMNPATARYIAYLQPKLVNEVDIVFRQVRLMSPQIHDLFLAIWRDYLERDLPPRLTRQPFRGPPQLARLLQCRHLRRHARHDFLRIQPYRGLCDRIEHVACRDYNQVYGLAVFFSQRNHLREQPLFVIGEQVFVWEIAFGWSGDQTRSHHHKVFLLGVGARQCVLEMSESVVVADAYHNVAWPRTHRLLINHFAVLELKPVQLRKR